MKSHWLWAILIVLGGCGTWQSRPQSSLVPASHSKYQFDYKVTNGEPIALVRVFDDGGSTYFQFRSNPSAALVISSETSNGETIIPHEAMENYAVILVYCCIIDGTYIVWSCHAGYYRKRLPVMRVATEIELTQTQRARLLRMAESQTTEVRLARRASIVLLCADGFDNQTVGEILGINRIQVARWRERYAAGGFSAIEQDLPRGGRTPLVDRAELVRLTTQTTPDAARGWPRATQWSSRTMAATLGVSHSTVSRIWKAHGLKPHRVERFKVSRDPRFVEKLDDVVGLYLSPPEHALGKL